MKGSGGNNAPLLGDFALEASENLQLGDFPLEASENLQLGDFALEPSETPSAR